MTASTTSRPDVHEGVATSTRDLDAMLLRGRVTLVVDGPVATVTLDRADRRNAQTPATWAALAAIGEALPAEVRVVVLRGAGQDFSAGLDRALLAPTAAADPESPWGLLTMSPQDALDTIGVYQQGFRWWRDPSRVTIAVVQGNAIGAGCQLALACHLRIALPDARFSLRETQLGLVPDLGGLQPLLAAVGPARATEMALTGRPVGAAEALAWGLVNAVVPAEGVDAALETLTEPLLGPPAGAITETLALLLDSAHRSLDEQLLAERTAQMRRFRELAGG